eukprot:TRINITY_DN2771_c0_g1_i2.p1 TRINITY_DN2771_c0_g1~~TRINITY_DN2771_c0_g1_i2.p1  ORF type:complete len:462 (+),score=83.49 TRINITY_DN2771_c0_g1_i2:32-1417(+)
MGELKEIITNLGENPRSAKEAAIVRLVNLLDTNGSRSSEELMRTLKREELVAILSCLDDEDATMRKAAALFVCLLLTNNHSAQVMFCDLMGLPPTEGRLCINKLQNVLKRAGLKEPGHVVDVLRRVNDCDGLERDAESRSLCWFMRLGGVTRRSGGLSEVELVLLPDEHQDVNIESFPDPWDCLIGVRLRIERSNSKPVSAREAAGKAARSPNVVKFGLSPTRATSGAASPKLSSVGKERNGGQKENVSPEVRFYTEVSADVGIKQRHGGTKASAYHNIISKVAKPGGSSYLRNKSPGLNGSKHTVNDTSLTNKSGRFGGTVSGAATPKTNLLSRLLKESGKGSREKVNSSLEALKRASKQKMATAKQKMIEKLENELCASKDDVMASYTTSGPAAAFKSMLSTPRVSFDNRRTPLVSHNVLAARQSHDFTASYLLRARKQGELDALLGGNTAKKKRRKEG